LALGPKTGYIIGPRGHMTAARNFVLAWGFSD
jgi:hypothetical protein